MASQNKTLSGTFNFKTAVIAAAAAVILCSIYLSKAAEPNTPKDPNDPNNQPAVVIKEANEPNKPSGFAGIMTAAEPNAVKDPNDPNNWPFVEIFVVDKQTYEPIKDARVKNYPNRNNVTTDNDGYCKVILGKQNPEYFSAYVEKKGFVPLHFNWGKEADRAIPREYTFYLEKGTVIGGTVKNDSNEPVQNANVIISFYANEANRNEPWQRIDNYIIKTDINGKWQCDMIPAELSEDRQVGIRIKHADYSDYQTWTQQEESSIMQLRNKEFVSVMKHGATIYGYIYNNQNRPIEKASVFIGEDRYNQDNLKAETDGSGYFEFVHAKQGFAVLTVLAKGYAPDMKELNVGSSAQTENFVLLPGNMIRGRVVNVKGNPVANAPLNADEWRGYRMVNWSGKTDKDGRFVWNEAPADEVKFDVYQRGYMSSRRNVLKTGRKEYEIVLYPPLEIYGSVTITETNEPVKYFTITRGLQFSENDTRIIWERQNQNPNSVKQFTNGQYKFQITNPYYKHLLRVDTNDGKYAISRAFDGNEGRVRYDFVVDKENADNLAGIVYLPDGKPAEGAKVYLVKKNQWLNLENGKQRYQQEMEKAVTDSQGKFTLSDCNEKFKLIAVSDEGFADVNNGEFSLDPAIHLEKWGRIEGVVYVGSKLAAGQEISANNSQKYNNRDNINYQYSNKATTDQQGKFVMEKVVPGENYIYRLIQFGDSDRMRSTSAARQKVEVLPGQTVEVVLGGKGRTIIGKIICPNEEFNKKVLEINAHIQPQQSGNIRELLEKIYSQIIMPVPADFDSLTAKQSVEWYKNFSQSEQGKAWQVKVQEELKKAGANLNTSGSSGGVIVNSDGSFRAEDVEAGGYMMSVNVMERKGRYGQADYQNPLLTGKWDFTMPPIDETNIDQPLDLGQVKLDVIATSQVMQAESNAPDFTLETNAGTIKSADLLGKYVVLVWWECFPVLSNDNSEADFKNILDAYQKYGNTGNVEFIGLSSKSIKISQDIAEKYLREKQCKWKQAFIGFDNPLVAKLNVLNYGQAIIVISPDGKIVASAKKGSELAEILAEKLTPVQ
ncbi:MAG: hypothetical protein WC770_03420 [Phycisphaerae bacterium]|jgi:hypothetical protein